MRAGEGQNPTAPAATVWRWHRFADLDAGSVHEILALRQQVFIVEQRCIYQDADACDSSCLHLTGRDGNGAIVAYARLLPPGLRFEAPSIGRLLTVRKRRRQGLATEAMRRAIAESQAQFPHHPVAVSAQLYLQAFYQRLGFHVQGQPYDEDNIPHVDMLLPLG